MKRNTFILLSFTWGLPMTLLGCLVAAVLLLTGHKMQRHGWCFYFEVGEGWGGLELGLFFITNKNPSDHIKNHEYGHAFQNIRYGWLMPFLVCIPSAIRYWYREAYTRANPGKTLPPYDSVWFEGEATKLGEEYIKTTDRGYINGTS